AGGDRDRTRDLTCRARSARPTSKPFAIQRTEMRPATLRPTSSFTQDAKRFITGRPLAPPMRIPLPLALPLVLGISLSAAESPGDRMLAQYFRDETARVNAHTFSGIKTL